MSLTALIAANKEFRSAVKAHTLRPEITGASAVYAEPRTKRHGLVGTAFDYLVGYVLERYAPDKVASRGEPVALRSLQILRSIAKSDGQRKEIRAVELAIEQHHIHAQCFIEDGHLTRELVASCLKMANLDQIYRAGIMPRSLLITPSPSDIADIFAMYRILPEERLSASTEVHIGPSFGWSSHLVGGADADFILDGSLIDTKTSMTLKIPLAMWCQVVGYYLLNRVEKLKGHPFIDIDRLGIYFARYGTIVDVPVSESILDPDLLTRKLFSL